MPQVMRPKKGFASGVIVSTRTVKDPSKNYSVGRTSANEFFLLSLSLSLLFHNLFTRLVLITRESYDFGTFGN